ncbi:hypothetical protein [Brevundimonas sp. SORGH_AS_0993]|uniref:hypothetical protein n=1 Tax=Brevundimonas sp. SORGH_AS_0993 TaxID=3041794 RepID=UPI0027D885AF|nr:hypothetical protein [Brevundimonas sp. SORGH_AS_0993]
MRPPILRRLTVLGWAVVLAVGLALMLAALAGLGFRWDPLGLERRRLEAARAGAAVAAAERQARSLEAEAAVAQARRLETHHTQITAGARATAAAVSQARSADDADIPVESRRADRLRGHDRELCRLAPELDGCAAAPAAAGGGVETVRPGGPAAPADDGRSG